jgi:hypothetical protein
MSEQLMMIMIRMHCISAEDLLPQRMHIGSWHGDKAYSKQEKLHTTLVYYFPGVK